MGIRLIGPHWSRATIEEIEYKTALEFVSRRFRDEASYAERLRVEAMCVGIDCSDKQVAKFRGLLSDLNKTVDEADMVVSQSRELAPRSGVVDVCLNIGVSVEDRACQVEGLVYVYGSIVAARVYGLSANPREIVADMLGCARGALEESIKGVEFCLAQLGGVNDSK